jgi:hypothetical protein
LFILFCTPLIARGTNLVSKEASNSNQLKLNGILHPDIRQYFVISLQAENTGSANYTSGTAVLAWNSLDNGYEDQYQERFKIYFDSSRHNYYIYAGQNRNWSEVSTIGGITFEIPLLDGIDIRLLDIALKERIFYPVDISLARLLENPLQPGYARINWLLIPSYIFFLISLILTGIYIILFKHKASGRKVFKRMVFVLILVLLLFFSATYIYREAISLRRYWKAYRDDILSGDIEGTYLGLYDFEKFILWAQKTIPDESNIIVLVKGEPVYILSEMAFNMYPRDIKFVDISGNTFNEVKSILEDLSGIKKDAYDYLVILSEDDIRIASGFELIARYRSTGGYIYKLR